MRLTILAAGAAFALSACGNNDQTDNNQNVDEDLTAENIVANDVTAIDAVTADAANMAADVDINFTNELAVDTGNDTAAAGQPPARPARTAKPATSSSRPSSSAPVAENTATNATE